MKRNLTNPTVGVSYLAPEVEILAISVEQGFAVSGGFYGDDGEAGQDIDNNDYGDF